MICPGANAAGGDREIGIPNMIDGFPNEGYTSVVDWAEEHVSRWFGNSIFEGCCRCSGGYRGHGIPESAVRWLFSASDNQYDSSTGDLNVLTHLPCHLQMN